MSECQNVRWSISFVTSRLCQREEVVWKLSEKKNTEEAEISEEETKQRAYAWPEGQGGQGGAEGGAGGGPAGGCREVKNDLHWLPVVIKVQEGKNI